jgi:hypothetical protein
MKLHQPLIILILVSFVSLTAAAPQDGPPYTVKPLPPGGAPPRRGRSRR